MKDFCEYKKEKKKESPIRQNGENTTKKCEPADLVKKGGGRKRKGGTLGQVGTREVGKKPANNQPFRRPLKAWGTAHQPYYGKKKVARKPAEGSPAHVQSRKSQEEKTNESTTSPNEEGGEKEIGTFCPRDWKKSHITPSMIFIKTAGT